MKLKFCGLTRKEDRGRERNQTGLFIGFAVSRGEPCVLI